MGFGKRLGDRPRDKEAGGRQCPAKIPVDLGWSPRPIPAEPVTINQPAGAIGLKILDNSLELEPLRQLPPIVTAW